MKKTIKYFNVITTLVLLLMSVFALASCRRHTPPEPPLPPVVEERSMEVSLSEENIFLQGSATLTVKILPETLDQKYKVDLSDRNLASYSDGVITGLAQGTVEITVTSIADDSLVEKVSLTIMPDLAEEKYDIILEQMVFPEPVISVAVEPKTRADKAVERHLLVLW